LILSLALLSATAHYRASGLVQWQLADIAVRPNVRFAPEAVDEEEPFGTVGRTCRFDIALHLERRAKQDGGGTVVPPIRFGQDVIQGKPRIKYAHARERSA
jgi:hypothetical protein